MCLARANRNPLVRSATELAFAPGVLVTTIPRLAAAAKSTLSVPTPYRAIALPSGFRMDHQGGTGGYGGVAGGDKQPGRLTFKRARKCCFDDARPLARRPPIIAQHARLELADHEVRRLVQARRPDPRPLREVALEVETRCRHDLDTRVVPERNQAVNRAAAACRLRTFRRLSSV